MKDKLIKFMMLTQSENDGEALNAMRMANKILKKENKTWVDVLGKISTGKSFRTMSDAEIDHLLRSKQANGSLKEQMLANLFMQLKTNGCYSVDTREKLAEHWVIR